MSMFSSLCFYEVHLVGVKSAVAQVPINLQMVLVKVV